MRDGLAHTIRENDKIGLFLLTIASILLYSNAGIESLHSPSINPVHALIDIGQVSASSMQNGDLAFLSLDMVQNNIHYANQLGPGGNWSEWINLGGNMTQIDVANNADGSVAVFGIGNTGNSTYYKHQLGPGGNWSEWIQLELLQIPRTIQTGTDATNFLSILIPGYQPP